MPTSPVSLRSAGRGGVGMDNIDVDYARGKGIGFSKFISMGNKAVTNELDFLRALLADDG